MLLKRNNKMVLSRINKLLALLIVLKSVLLNTLAFEAEQRDPDKQEEPELKALVKICVMQINIGAKLSNYRWFKNKYLLNDIEKESLKKKIVQGATEHKYMPRMEIADQFLNDQMEAIRLVQCNLFNEWSFSENTVGLEKIQNVDVLLETFYAHSLNQLSLLKELELVQFSENCMKRVFTLIHLENLENMFKYAIYRTLGSFCLVMIPNGESVKIHATYKKSYPQEYFDPFHLMNLTYGRTIREKDLAL